MLSTRLSILEEVHTYTPETSSPAPEHMLAYAGVLMDARIPAID